MEFGRHETPWPASRNVSAPELYTGTLSSEGFAAFFLPLACLGAEAPFLARTRHM